MGFFDFAASYPRYREDSNKIHRLNKRHDFLVRPFVDDIKDARVLDLAAHDGRWSYAFSSAGAKSVVGIEGRQSIIDDYSYYPEGDAKSRVELRQGDIFSGMELALENGEKFDVVACVGILYHIMDHMRLINLVRSFSPRLVIVDSLFIDGPSPFIQIVRERTDFDLNTTPLYDGQDINLIGIPSDGAMNAMAEVCGFAINWTDWTVLPPPERTYLHDYYSMKRRRRRTCSLRPK